MDGGKNIGLMFLNEVILGKEHHIKKDDPSFVSAPKVCVCLFVFLFSVRACLGVLVWFCCLAGFGCGLDLDWTGLVWLGLGVTCLFLLSLFGFLLWVGPAWFGLVWFVSNDLFVC